jgi:hypothetical protein
MKRPLESSTQENVVDNTFAPGDQVRLVNLPAYPGLEGLGATVTAVDESRGYIDVELKKTGATKRLKAEKLRHVLSDCVVELHSLVAAYKLNGQWGEIMGFDWDMQRYELLLENGSNKKVKPENVRYVASYSRSPIPRSHLVSIPSDYSDLLLSARVDLFRKWRRPLPYVISSRVLSDWVKLDDPEMRQKLIATRRVDLASLISTDIKLLHLSFPRTEVVSDRIDDDKLFGGFCKYVCTKSLEDYFGGQVYFILPMGISPHLALPHVSDAFHVSSCLLPWLADSVLAVHGGQFDPVQSLDIVSASLVTRSVFVWSDSTKSPDWSNLEKTKIDLVECLKFSNGLDISHSDLTKVSVIAIQ